MTEVTALIALMVDILMLLPSLLCNMLSQFQICNALYPKRKIVPSLASVKSPLIDE